MRIIRMFVRLPKSTVAQVLGKHGSPFRNVNRCELPGSPSWEKQAEFIAKVGDSLRELEETAYWLELLVDGKIVTASKLESLRRETNELTAIFVTILKRSKES